MLLGNRNSGFALGMFAIMILSACGSQRTTVHEGAQVHHKSSTVTVMHDASKKAVQVDEAHRMEFEATVKRLLIKRGFTEGNGLVLKYWFSDADEGSRSARFWLGFGAGTGRLQVSVEYYDSAGNKLANTDNVGTVSGGFSGGSYTEAIVNASEAIATYTKKTYYGREATVVAPAPAAPVTIAAQPVSASPPPAPVSQPSAPVAAPVPAPKAGLQTWQLAVNTNPQGAIIKAYDDNQALYQIGKSPAGFLWPLQTQADALVVFWQGRQVSLIPQAGESVTVDFTKHPPEVKGATIIDNAR